LAKAKQNKKIIFISWARSVPRSKGIATALGARDFYVEYLKGCPNIFLPIRYLAQAIKTFSILIAERPNLIIAMNPPIVCPLVVWLYTKATGAQFVIDSGHTGAFIGKWKRLFFLQKPLSQRALVTLITNPFLATIVDSWKAFGFVLPDMIPYLPFFPEVEARTGYRIGVVFTFDYNEPVESVLKAAELLPEFNFEMTGDIHRASASVVRIRPKNLQFTGFLRGDDYVQFLNRNDAIMVLTTTDCELSCAAYEGIALGKPLILSNWTTIREYFNEGAVYVDNTVEGIVQGIRYYLMERIRLMQEVFELKRKLNADMLERIRKLKSIIMEH